MSKRTMIFMTMLVALLSIFTFTASTGVRAQSSFGMALFDSEALNTANAWASLISKADVAGLEALLNDKYVHIHATALIETKDQFVEALRTSARKYDPIKLEETSCRVFGNFAIVTGRFNLKAFSRGRTVEGVNRFSLTILKSPAGVQVVSFQATAIPQNEMQTR